jgi:DNA repair protein RecO (recombination protein O)
MAEREIVRTEAVVLRSLNYGETSQIVTLLTRKKGKLGVMAKGARRPKSSFGATLQPMAYTQVVFYYKPTRDLQILSESSHVESFHRLRRDLDTITIGLRVVELVEALLEEEDPQPEIFALTVRVLQRLNRTESRAANLWPYVQLRLASLLGIAPAVDRANVEAVEEEGLLSRANGGVYPPDAAPEAPQRASRAALRAYAVFARADLDTVMRMELTPAVRREVETLVRDFLRYHVEEAYPERSEAVIAQLDRSPAQTASHEQSY